MFRDAEKLINMSSNRALVVLIPLHPQLVKHYSKLNYVWVVYSPDLLCLGITLHFRVTQLQFKMH